MYVDSIVLEQRSDGRKKATGVLLQGLEGEKIEVKASKEVLLCGGSFGSPAILLRSGIGPKHEVQAVNLESKVDLKGVGKNLMDHPVSGSLHLLGVARSEEQFNCFAWAETNRKERLAWRSVRCNILTIFLACSNIL